MYEPFYIFYQKADNFLKIDNYIKKIETIVERKINSSKNKFIELIAKLDSLSPLKTLVRGYSIIEKNGVVVSSSNDLSSGDELKLRFIDGSKDAVIK